MWDFNVCWMSTGCLVSLIVTARLMMMLELA